MQVKAIQSLLKLYETENISSASAQLFITQQGLSRQIQALEKELDVPLFERGRGGTVPTELCRQLYPHFKAMCAEYETALRALEQRKQEHRQALVVGFAYGISSAVSTEFLLEYQKQCPDQVLEIQEWSKQACIDRLLHGELDVAILVNPFDARRMHSVVLAEDYMYAAMYKTHPLAASSEPLDFRLLEGERIITGPQENALRQLFDYYCELVGVRPQILVASSFNLSFANSMAESTGIATLPSAQALRITNPDIRIRRFIMPEPGYMYGCTSTHGKSGNAADALLRYAKEYFEKRPVPKYPPEASPQ